MSGLRTVLLATLLVPMTAFGQGAGKGPDKSPPQNVERQNVGRQNGQPTNAPRTETERRAYEKRKAEIRRRIQKYRAMMKSGKVLKTHVKVRVKLRNGEMMIGVVRDGLFIERPAGLEFVRAEMKQPGAGLRLWYYNQTDGYIFIPYTMIKTYKILKRLTDIEIKEIREQILERERLARERGEQRRKELADKQEALRQGGESAQKLEELAKKLEQDKKKAAEEKRLLGLVKEFPPDEGWGEEKINQINLRRLTIKVFPNPKERRFIEVFEDWKAGRDLAKKLEESKKGTKKRVEVGEPKPPPQPDKGGAPKPDGK